MPISAKPDTRISFAAQRRREGRLGKSGAHHVDGGGEPE